MRQSLGSDDRGSVAVLFAVCLLPVLGLMGVGVDYARGAALRTRLHRAVDAALLTNAPRISQSTLNQDITAQVAAAFKPNELTNLNVTVTVATGTLTTSATATVGRVMPLLGMPTMNIAATAAAKWGSKDFEVSLVIDNSGSMSETMGGTTKMAAVITAAKGFVDYLSTNVPSPATVKVGLVPFDSDVNIGSGNTSATWIDRSSLNCNGSCQGNNGNGNGNGNWNGCVWDRTQNYDVSNAPPTGGTSTQYQPDPSRTSSCSLRPLMPLTTSLTTVKTSLDAMTAVGSTNLTIGLAWGFSLLTPNSPFAGASPIGGSGAYKSVILMTDGQNTKNRWSTTTSQINIRTSMVCDNIKGQNIEIYTIGTVDADDTVLRACATNPSMYYKVTTGNEMTATFNEIARKISRLRLSS